MPSRLFTGEPWGNEAGVELYERDGLGFRAYRWSVESDDEVTDVVTTIAGAAHGAHGMAPIDVTVAQPAEFLMLVWATGFGIVLFDETPSLWVWVGAGVIVPGA